MAINQLNSESNVSSSDVLKVLLVDDQKFVQHKLQQMLSEETDIEIIGIANDGETAIDLVESLEPDVVLIDIEMPKMNGIEATKIISQRYPHCKILILSSHEQQEYVQDIIMAGADGYILKSISTKDLVMAIHSVCKGYSHFGSQLFKKVRLAQSVEPVNTAVADSQINLTQQLAPRQAGDFLPPISSWLTWGGISVVAIAILTIPAAAVFKYKTVVKAQAVVRSVEELHLVQAPVEGQVAQILVKEGQEVKQGDAIATIDRSDFKTKQSQLEQGIQQQQLQLEQLNAQIANLASQIVAETQSNQAEIIAAKSELAGSQRSYKDKNAEATTVVAESEAQVEAVRATLNAARAKYDRYKSVADAGAIGKNQLAEAELQVKQQQQELAAARAKLRRSLVALNPSSSEVDVARQRIEQAQKSGRASIAALNREQEALVQQRIGISKQREQDTAELNQISKELAKTKINATATGTIFQLNLRNSGQTLQAGQEIAQIIPEDFQVEMKADVSPQDISKLKIGQPVQMRVSACPYPDYGTLKGKVSQIAGDTRKIQQQVNNPQSQSASAAYEVSISPDSRTFGRAQKQCALKLGMESEASIITREETALQFLLRKARLTTNL